jgi:hypothetical protein
MRDPTRGEPHGPDRPTARAARPFVPHRIVLRGRLVHDVARREPVRVVARLGEGEGEAQARALLDGSAIDEGYLARARREPRPFVRELTEDLAPGGGMADEADREPDGAADEPPLAA